MTTRADINGLPLDQGLLRWPLYRGTQARRVHIYGFAPRWDEYQAMVQGLKGGPATLNLRGVRQPGGRGGSIDLSIPEVYVTRATKVNEVLVDLWCYDARLLINRHVGDMDFNMQFGDGILYGTEFDTYKAAIEAYANRIEPLAARLHPKALANIPERTLEPNVHLSALAAADPLDYLCGRIGVDLAVDATTGKFYFASRQDASASWFAGFEEYNWLERPGFLTLETVVLQRPKKILSYYWEHHCVRAQASDPNATVSSYGPEETQIVLTQVYLYNGEYFTLDELLDEIGGGLGTGTVTDAQIARAYFSDSAEPSSLHPCDTFARKTAWAIIRRDWRRLWRIEFPDGSTGGWDQWRFGKLLEDGSLDPVSVECPWVEFKRVINVAEGDTVEGKPWTFNHTTDAPFKAAWDDGPESGVIRIYNASDESPTTHVRESMPGALRVTRINGASGPENQLAIVKKDEINNGEKRAVVRNLTLLGLEDITAARFDTSFSMFIYLVGRRFMPNDKTRWHEEEADGFTDGDIERVELPPSAELNCYRTFVGGTAPTPEDDGLGAILNSDALQQDMERRAEVWKLNHSQSAEGQGRADTLALAQRERLVDGPVVEASVVVDKVETYCEVIVGNIADDKGREMIAMKRLAARKVQAQGVPVA